MKKQRERWPQPDEVEKLPLYEEIQRTIERLKRLCRRQGVSLYLAGTDDTGNRIYKIKEVPSFRALVRTVWV